MQVKNIIYSILSLLIVAGTIFVESHFDNTVVLGKADSIHDSQSSPVNQIFQVPEEHIPFLAITYDLDKDPTAFDPLTSKAPKILQTEPVSATFKLFNDTNIVLGKQSQLNTLVFTRNKYHGTLVKGKMLLDNRIQTKTTTVQLSNALISPYPNGVFYISNINNDLEIQVLSGNAEIGIYNNFGQLQRSFLLPKNTKLTAFDAFAEEGDINIETFSRKNEFHEESVALGLIPSLSDSILNSNFFTLTYKQNLVQPKEQNKTAQLAANLSFNTKRKNYHSLAPFYAELNSVLTSSQNKRVALQDFRNLQTIYNQDILTNSSAQAEFQKGLQEKIPSILAIRPNENLYELKIFLLSLIKTGQIPSAHLILSEMEDLYFLYREDNHLQTSKSIERILESIPTLGKTDSQNILAIVDNLADTVITSNTQELFSVRNELYTKLTTPIEKSQFDSKTRQHLARLENAYSSNQLPSSQIKTATETLLKTLSAATQGNYQDFLLGIK